MRPNSACAHKISAFVSRAVANRPASVHVVTTTRYRITACQSGNSNCPFCKLQYACFKTSGTSAIVLVGFCSRSMSCPVSLFARRRAMVSAAEFEGAQTRSDASGCLRMICSTASTRVFVLPGFACRDQQCIDVSSTSLTRSRWTEK